MMNTVIGLYYFIAVLELIALVCTLILHILTRELTSSKCLFPALLIFSPNFHSQQQSKR